VCGVGLEDKHRLLVGLDDECHLRITVVAEVEVVGLEVTPLGCLVGEVAPSRCLRSSATQGCCYRSSNSGPPPLQAFAAAARLVLKNERQNGGCRCVLKIRMRERMVMKIFVL
jgi:hypothetical protein